MKKTSTERVWQIWSFIQKELPPERMHNRCPLCMAWLPNQLNKSYIESKVLHIVGVHHRTIEEANDLISRYNPEEP